MLAIPVAPAAGSATRAPEAVSKQSFQAVLESRDSRGAAHAPPPVGAAFGERTLQTVRQIERAQERLDTLLAAAQRGQTFTAQQLLALQSEAYRYGQTVELAAKVVEQGAQSVKQAVNTQV
jgi:hypothetical protein